MPRSPSPYRRYHDDSPRRYRDDRDRYRDRDRGYGDYRGPPRRDYRDSRDFRDERRWDDRREYDRRPYSRDHSPAYSRDGRSPPYASSSKDSPSKPISTPNLTVRSGSPEEGQITSPSHTASGSLPPKPPSGLVPSPRRRSPSPPPRWSDRNYRREPWRERERDFGNRGWRDDRGDRDRERDWDRGRDYRYSGGDDRRGSRSPRPYRRSPSRSSISSHSPSRSSRFASPRKRSPERFPPPRAYNDTGRHSPPRDVKREERSPPPSISERRPSFATSRPPPSAPSGPRSDRAPPTGPRALSGGYVRPPPPTVGPSSANFSSIPATREYEETKSSAKPTSEDKIVNPYKNPATPSIISISAGRPSWSETKPAVPIPNPQTPMVRAPEIKREPEEVPDMQVKIEPMPEAAQPKAEPDISPEERKAQEAEMRILMEIRNIPTKYGIAQWEMDLEAHYTVVQNLSVQTSRAQSAARIAGAILADAEAERVMMGQRRKAADKLLADDWDALGIPGVSGL